MISSWPTVITSGSRRLLALRIVAGLRLYFAASILIVSPSSTVWTKGLGGGCFSGWTMGAVSSVAAGGAASVGTSTGRANSGGLRSVLATGAAFDGVECGCTATAVMVAMPMNATAP